MSRKSRGYCDNGDTIVYYYTFLIIDKRDYYLEEKKIYIYFLPPNKSAVLIENL